MKPSLARFSLAVALLGSISAALLGLALSRLGSPDHVTGRILWWALAACAAVQILPATGYMFAPGALQQGSLPLWSRAKKRAFTAWAIFATPVALFGVFTAVLVFIFGP